ncbi:membrane protein [Streptomyces lavendofoliae]|uniref:Membrane protein n=1 Tax=Streptomyces lavendofoliae TaxID=67314 RepID=A0A918M1H1_9ACTN|nr:membrane protein [Streptomyces lavendofoliae]
MPPDPAPAPAALPLPYGTPPWAYKSVPRSLPRRLAPPLGILAGVAAAFAYVGTIDPNEPGHYPVCPLFRLTGLLCPGCGGLRSAHAFIHGDLPTALGANAVAVAGYAVFAVAMVFWLVGAVRGRPARITLRPVWWWSAGVVLALFSIVRNLPFGSALAP